MVKNDLRYRGRIPKPFPTGRFLAGWGLGRDIARIPAVGILGGKYPTHSGKTLSHQRGLLAQIIGGTGAFRKWAENVRKFDSPSMMMMQKVKIGSRLKEFIEGRPLVKRLKGVG